MEKKKALNSIFYGETRRKAPAKIKRISLLFTQYFFLYTFISLHTQLSSEQVVREYIKRIRVVEPFLNAVIEDRFEDAINDAKKADKIIAETPSLIYLVQNYPLLGVPFTVKESIAVKGMSHVSGMVWRKGLKATCDAVVVEKMRAAGAIPLLVSTTPEYCLSWECHSLIHGRTHNPHDLGRTSGGSSGDYQKYVKNSFKNKFNSPKSIVILLR